MTTVMALRNVGTMWSTIHPLVAKARGLQADAAEKCARVQPVTSRRPWKATRSLGLGLLMGTFEGLGYWNVFVEDRNQLSSTPTAMVGTRSAQLWLL